MDTGIWQRQERLFDLVMHTNGDDCGTDSPLFLAAIAIGFHFKIGGNKDKGYAIDSYDRESLQEWIRENGPTQSRYVETHVYPDGFKQEEHNFVYGFLFRIPILGGGYFEFLTRDESYLEDEMRNQRIQRESKAIAKDAPDPKTPPRTMKTRTDIM